jgi:hypothetical protein
MVVVMVLRVVVVCVVLAVAVVVAAVDVVTVLTIVHFAPNQSRLGQGTTNAVAAAVLVAAMAKVAVPEAVVIWTSDVFEGYIYLWHWRCWCWWCWWR